MLFIALRMLLGDRVKFAALVGGVAFSTLLCVQLTSIFVGVIRLAAFMVIANPQVDVWVMRPGVEATDWVEQMPQNWFERVKGVPGVQWAVPFYRGSAMTRTPAGVRVIQVMGVDDSTLTGAPGLMLSGNAHDLRLADAVIPDISTYKRLFPDLDVSARPVFEIGKRRVRVVGVCRATRSITGGDMLFARRSVAVDITQEPNNTVTFALVKSDGTTDPDTLAARIQTQTGLVAHGSHAFSKSIVRWTLANTGIVEVLGSVIVLSVLIGVLVVGQTFYVFTHENARYFATLKAMGAPDLSIILMISAQSLFVAVIGYGIGLGGATLLLRAADTDLSAMRGLSLSAEVALAVAILMPILIIATAMAGAYRVLRADPALVFKA